MSETSRKDKGYPRSEVNMRHFMLFLWCGGFGGGGCPETLDATQFVYPIRVSKYIRLNRSLLFNNPEFKGVDIFSDGGPDGCDHSKDTRQPFWLAFSADGVMTDAEVKAADIELNQAPPFDILVPRLKLPQPKDPGWDNIIYVHIVWDSAAYVTDDPMQDGILKTIKHDYDVGV